MSVASYFCAAVYALFWRKVTNIGYPPIIVWENQICSADFGYAVSPCISKMGCFSNTALTEPSLQMVFVLMQQILPSTTSAQRPRPSLQPESANFLTLELCGWGKFWSVEMHTSMSWDPNVPPWQSFPLGNRKESWGLSPKTLCKSLQPSWLSHAMHFPTYGPPFFMGRWFPHGTVSSGTYSNHCHRGWCTGTTQNCPEPASERNPTMVHCM